jgi:hypothetical protein
MVGGSAGIKDRDYIFLCSTRDYHAMDWFRSANELKDEGRLGRRLAILTESRGGEGFPDLARDGDEVHELFIIDRLLLSRQTRWGSLWRNAVKFLLLPLQILLLYRFAARNPGNLYFAHSMYYIWLAWAAGVDFVGTPQGSDLLVKPNRSAVYRYLTVKSLRAAKVVTVDSEAMARASRDIADVEPEIIQNGIDIKTIKNLPPEEPCNRDCVVSPRAITPLYRIDAIVDSINTGQPLDLPVEFIYPFFDEAYHRECIARADFPLNDNGRVARERMYELFRRSRLVLSIPSSDSSPRSVYEAIFCGAPVAICPNAYHDTLPASMRSRVILVDLKNPDWFDDALLRADTILSQRTTIDPAEWDLFDQRKSLEKLIKIADSA